MRNETIDIMKAFCIIGVVLLHAVFIYYGENTELSNTLRLVCVSGFFILSGYVIYGKIQNTKWMVGKIIRRTPMLVIFTLLFWGFNNYVVGVDGNQVLEIPLGNYILYNIGSGFILSVLWYIWMLNIGYVVLWAFEKYKFKRFYLLQIGALMCLTFIPLDYGGFNLFRWYGLFFISGYAWNYIKDKNTVSRVWIGFIIVSVFAVSRGALSYSGEAVNGGFVNILQSFSSGEAIYANWYISITATGIALLYVVSKWLSRFKVSKGLIMIGSSTIGVLLLHKPLLELGAVNNYWLSFIIVFMLALSLYQLLKRVEILNFMLFGGTDIPYNLSMKLGGWYEKVRA